MAAAHKSIPIEYFAEMGVKLKKQNIEKTSIKSTSDVGISTAYGYQEIASTSNGIYKWNLKIENGGKGVMVVGISSTNQDLETAFYKNTNTPNYGYNLFSGFKVSCAKFAKYGKKAKINDYITTILDLNKGTIAYHINNIKQPIAHHIQQNEFIKYRFCVSIQDNMDMVTLQKFQIVKQIPRNEVIQPKQMSGSNIKTDKNKQLELLKQQNTELKMKISILETESKEKINHLETQNSDLRREEMELETQINILENNAIQMQHTVNNLDKKISILEHEKKEYDRKINVLTDKVNELQKKVIDIKMFTHWNETDVLNWIFSVHNGLFLKYEKELRYQIIDNEIKGIDLLKMKRNDIKEFGVKKFADQKILQEKIDMLRNINDHNDNNKYEKAVAPAYAEGPIVDTAK